MKTICIDFDGVLHDYSKGWQGVDVFSGAVDGASEGTHQLKEAGWIIIIFTTRNDTPALRKWLADNGIAFDYINYNPNQPVESEKGKLIADIYLDDRGLRFDGDWKKTIIQIGAFCPWQECGKEKNGNG